MLRDDAPLWGSLSRWKNLVSLTLANDTIMVS